MMKDRKNKGKKTLAAVGAVVAAGLTPGFVAASAAGLPNQGSNVGITAADVVSIDGTTYSFDELYAMQREVTVDTIVMPDIILEPDTSAIDVPVVGAMGATKYGAPWLRRNAAQAVGDDETVYRSVEQMPLFPGGDKALMSFIKSHINYVVADTHSWEQIAAKTLEEIPEVECYVKNHFLDFRIPYLLNGKEHQYIPDFIARIVTPKGDAINLIIEISGFSDDIEGSKDAKRQYVSGYWLPAANNLAKYGRWDFIEIDDIDNIKKILKDKIQQL